jgi:GGDEF domain-containing protein
MKNHKKKRAGDASIAGAIIAAICIVIYIFAVVQAVVRFYLSVDQSRITSEQEFSRIADIATTAGMRAFMDDNFIQTMNNALARSNTIEALIISGPDGEYAFEKHQGRAVTWVNNSPRFISRFSFANQNHNRPLPLRDVRNVNIQASAAIFDYYDFSRILKETLLIIMIGFALAFFTMLLQLLLGKPAEKFTQTVYAPSSGYAGETPMAPAERATETGSNDLYSSRSNIGWEEHIKDRLDLELHHCSSTEKDLALIILEFTDITNDAMFRQAVEEAVSFFASRDLLFGYGSQGISVILPGVNLDAAITRAEKFYQRVMEKFPHGYRSAPSLCIGLSSRSGRLLNAERLIFETKEALKRAKKSSTSIIAFKSDLEKYRTFIASQNSKAL